MTKPTSGSAGSGSGSKQPVVKTFKINDYIFLEGQPSDSMYIVRSGIVSIRKSSGDKHYEIARIFSGEVLGELSFFDRQPRSASAVAVTVVEVLRIEYDQLELIYKNVPDYLKTIITSLAERLRKANELIQRLQRGKTDLEESKTGKGGEDSAASILAATADILVDSPPVLVEDEKGEKE